MCVSGREKSRRVGRREKEVYKTGKKSRAAAGLSFRIRSFRGKFRTCSIFKECLSFPSPPQGLNWLWGWKGKEKRRVVLVYFRFPQSTVELCFSYFHTLVYPQGCANYASCRYETFTLCFGCRKILPCIALFIRCRRAME